MPGSGLRRVGSWQNPGAMSDCPWSGFTASPPAFCERALCAWIREPGNTASNLAFVLVALWILWETRGAERHLRPIAWITLATAVGSGLYHATGTAWGELADYAGMDLGGAFMLSVCVRRWTLWRGRRARGVFWALFAGAIVPGIFSPSLLRPFYAADGAICSLSEGALYFTRARAASYRWLLVTWAFFLPAMALWWLDVSRVWCDPDRHALSGHALWHVLNAAGFYAAFRYYRQFDVLRG